MFHRSLRQGGILSLGTAETIGKMTDLFEAIPNTIRVFRRIGGSERQERAIVSNIRELTRSLWPRVVGSVERSAPISATSRSACCSRRMRGCCLVNRKYQGLYFVGDRSLSTRSNGRTSRFCPPCYATVYSEVPGSCRQASREHAPVTIHGARVKRNGGHVMVSISARPVPHEDENCVGAVGKAEGGRGMLGGIKMVEVCGGRAGRVGAGVV